MFSRIGDTERSPGRKFLATLTLAAVATSGLLAANSIGATPAVAATQNNYVFNDAWKLTGADASTKYSPTSPGYHSATSSLPTTTGAVSMTAQFDPDAARNPGTTVLADGSDQSAYGASANMFIGTPDPKSLPALGLYTQGSDGCGGSLGSAAHQNFNGECTVGTLTVTFSRPVTDMVFDISGLGGYVSANRTKGNGYARGSFNSTIWEIASPDVSFADASGGATNLAVDAKRLAVAETNTYNRCDSHVQQFAGQPYAGPETTFAGCGSAILKGTYTKVVFNISAHDVPYSAFSQAQYNTGPLYFQNDGTADADGINGLNTTPTETALLPDRPTVDTSLQNADLQRISFRLPQTGALGDRVWADSNGNGIQDDGETGIAGVTVQLLDADGNPVKDAQGNPITTTTDSNGAYSFTDLPLGTYTVKFTDPNGRPFTQQHAGGDGAKDSDVDPSNGVSGPVTLTSDQPVDNDVDAGIVPGGHIGDRVWRDDNGDGVQEDGEPGVSGVTVILHDANGKEVARTTTDANGAYSFDDLPFGDYTVQFQAPDGTHFTTQGAGSDPSKDSDADPSTGSTSTITLTPQHPIDDDVDAGLIQRGSLGDKVWFDSNGDGIQDSGEPGVSGVTVHLLDKDGKPIVDADGKEVVTTTDKDGNYLFSDLPLGDYRIKVDVPAGDGVTQEGAGTDRSADSDIDSAGNSGVVSLTLDQPNRRDIDAGLIDAPQAADDRSDHNTIGSTVSVPVLNNDKGDLDPSTVKLINPNGEPVDSLTVPGEGTWTVDPTSGAVSFAPESGFTGNPTPVDYTVQDRNGNKTAAKVTVTYDPQATDDRSDHNTIGSAVTVPTLDNDKGDLDPSTVKITDPQTGDPVDSLTVPGEGTWTVDPKTGAVTFTPEDGFTKNPTPIDYTVKDRNGNQTGAKVTVTYDPQAIDDRSDHNTIGSTVTVPALDNDKGDLDPSTVKITDPQTGDPVDSLTVPGEGTWTVDPKTGAVTFTPEDGFTKNPTPIDYTVKDRNGNQTGAKVTVTYDPQAIDDESLGNASGSTVTVPTLGNDKGDLDPSTVRITDPKTGEALTSLAVPGEGTWTVDEKTGDITFAPEKGFLGNPTPIDYTVKDRNGNQTGAKVTITYLAPVPPIVLPGGLAITGLGDISWIMTAAGLLLIAGAIAVAIGWRRRES